MSFHPALERNPEFETEEYISARNDTLKHLLSSATREKRQSSLPERRLQPPNENSTASPFLYPTSESPKPYSTDSYLNSAVESANGRKLTEVDELRTASSHYRAILQEVSLNTADEALEEFPIVKAMAETMCPGFGSLIPYHPKTIHSDVLLIVVFTNQHYDLIPTLEVLYRPYYPNILYCGHPHESVEIFLNKYQTVERRSFTFLPTYTRATYECVLGAMEMNYDVNGYLVINDETLITNLNDPKFHKDKIWVGSDKEFILSERNWRKLDPRGQKLPKLLDGVLNTWKLFSYILVGHDTWILDSHHHTEKKVVF